MNNIYLIIEKNPFISTPLVLIDESVWSKGKSQKILCEQWYFESDELAQIYAKKKYGEDFKQVVIIIPIQSRDEFVKESLKHKTNI